MTTEIEKSLQAVLDKTVDQKKVFGTSFALKKGTSELILKYIDILRENGEPNEAYKYLAINTFQQNWDLEADDFYQMFRASFSKVANLLYQNSWGFIHIATQLFPNEVREMFRKLYNESVEITERIKTFQTESEKLLSKVREKLNRTNIKAQQDERTISVYLAFRFPEKYMLYKYDYYKNFCKELNIKPKKTGECFLHLQELANLIIREDLLDENFLKTYRKFYQKPDWDDQYLMIQNVLYVVFRDDFKEMDLVKLLKNFNRKDLEEYYEFLDKIIEEFDLQQNDQKLVFNHRDKWIVFTIGQRYIWRIRNSKSSEPVFAAISTNVFTTNHSNFEGEPNAFWNGTDDILEIRKNKEKIFDAIKKELKTTRKSSFLKYNKKELERMAFDIDFRNEILSQLETQTKTEKPMENTKPDKKTPLNQILFGAPGTGKTYTTKRIAVEIINGEKQRTRQEINAEYEDLINKKQIVFTTFHQSLSYEDFIEGIKPETEEGNVTYEIKDGIFKDLAKRAVSYNKLSETDEQVYDFDSAWNDLIEEVNATIQKDEKFELPILTINKGLNVTEITNQGNLKLKPKSNVDSLEYTVSYNRTKKLQEAFPSLSVVKNIDREFRSVIGGSNSTAYWAVLNYINTKINANQKPKIEKRNFSPQKYVLIIDEINRGNVSAIFGELITLLEEDKRKGNKEQTEVILPYSHDKFSVPNNVYLIGTMNTADRSVEALDTALRRRFSFIEMQPNSEVLSNSEYQDVDLKQLLETINQRIEVLIDKDHQIGHAYFIGIQNLEDLKWVFKDKIIPLLEEYFYGDFGKIGLVLGGKFIYQEENTAKFPKNFSYENDFLEDKKVYRFTSSEYWDESTFISVYED
ncbi:AAA family ATPase [Weeksella virosa]|uniref:McrB family protein n=1 Tax=Weeksella virosa TaxID=1014 RepID=UPI002554D4D9|nr:AAA family ATPase [Weeksella virosa]MDK7374802.1 AAA family ATPase [Weeksella virosa]